MIKVYKPLLGGENVRCSEISGNETEVWAELTCAMKDLFNATCTKKGRKIAEKLLELAVAHAMSDGPDDGKDGTDE